MALEIHGLEQRDTSVSCMNFSSFSFVYLMDGEGHDKGVWKVCHTMGGWVIGDGLGGSGWVWDGLDGGVFHCVVQERH